MHANLRPRRRARKQGLRRCKESGGSGCDKPLLDARRGTAGLAARRCCCDSQATGPSLWPTSPRAVAQIPAHVGRARSDPALHAPHVSNISPHLQSAMGLRQAQHKPGGAAITARTLQVVSNARPRSPEAPPLAPKALGGRTRVQRCRQGACKRHNRGRRQRWTLHVPLGWHRFCRVIRHTGCRHCHHEATRAPGRASQLRPVARSSSMAHPDETGSGRPHLRAWPRERVAVGWCQAWPCCRAAWAWCPT